MPKAVHICQLITNAPLIFAGLFSAAKMGTVEPFSPIPTPISRRVMNNSSQVCVKAPPIGASRQKTAEMKMVPRRPYEDLWLVMAAQGDLRDSQNSSYTDQKANNQ